MDSARYWLAVILTQVVTLAIRTGALWKWWAALGLAVLVIGYLPPAPYYRGNGLAAKPQCQQHAPQAQCEKRWPMIPMGGGGAGR